MPDHLFEYALFDAAAVNALASVTTPAIDLRFLDRAESLLIKLASAGAPDVKVEYAISKSDADADFGGFDDYADLIASSNLDLAPTPKGWHAVALPNFLAPWIKLKVTGVGANPADTTVTLRLLCRELI